MEGDRRSHTQYPAGHYSPRPPPPIFQGPPSTFNNNFHKKSAVRDVCNTTLPGQTDRIQTPHLTVLSTLRSTRDLRLTKTTRSQKIETEAAVIVACLCNNYHNKVVTVQKPGMKQKKKVKAGKDTES